MRICLTRAEPLPGGLAVERHADSVVIHTRYPDGSQITKLTVDQARELIKASDLSAAFLIQLAAAIQAALNADH